MKKNGQKNVNRYMLKLEMLLATPGAKLHKGLRRLRRNRELSGGLLLIVILLLAGVVLWQLRGMATWLLLSAGAGLAVLFFLLFTFLRRRGDLILGIGEMLTYPFYSSYVQCREALWDAERERAGAAAGRTSASAHAGRTGQTEKAKKTESAGAQEEKRKQDGPDAQASAGQQEKSRKQDNARKKEDSGHAREERRRTVPRNARLEEAKAFFGVDIPYTTEEIKQRRNQLLKKYHPDNPGGSEEMCKKINECYALLARYAA